jgi:hypothetical protein
MGDVRDQILSGIRHYLQTEFCSSAVHEVRGAHTGTVMFAIEDVTGRHRLEVTEMYLQGDEGAEELIRHLTDWHVADVIRRAKPHMARLTTSGVRVERLAPAHPDDA